MNKEMSSDGNKTMVCHLGCGCTNSFPLDYVLPNKGTCLNHEMYLTRSTQRIHT